MLRDEKIESIKTIQRKASVDSFYSNREKIRSLACAETQHKFDHRLNGSSSPVLTATSLSYGKAKNSTPTESKPLI